MFVNQSRRKTMMYKKPEIHKIGGAVASIQSTHMKEGGPTDGKQVAQENSINAYEADE
jgi:hypothetical protein